MDRSLISIAQLDRSEIEHLIDAADKVARDPAAWARSYRPVVGLVFLQESTRTRIGFEVAAFRLGGHAVLIGGTKYHTGMSGAEPLADTVRSIESYCDVLCIRHADVGMVECLRKLCARPVVNCGNGDDEHPTQALIDLMTIRQLCGRLDFLTVVLVGDLRFSRAAHSLALALSRFDRVTLRAISPRSLRLPTRYCGGFGTAGRALEETDVLELAGADVVYVSGFPPRTPTGDEYCPEARRPYRITAEVLADLPAGVGVLCPLPRIDEIDTEVDALAAGQYFRQSANGLAMRIAVLTEVLG